MVRVLHLHETPPDFETQRTVGALMNRLGEGFDPQVKTIGRGGDYRNLIGAVPMLRRVAADYDIIHAWGRRALMTAAMSTRGAIVFSPTAAEGARSLRWVRAAMAHRTIHIVSPTATLRRIFVERGIPLNQCHLIRPGVDFGAIRARRNPQLRADLGFSEGDRVLLAIGESTRAAAHHQAAWACSILHVVEPRYRLLLWGRSEKTRQVRRFADRLAVPKMLVVAPREMEFEELFAAADAAIISASGATATLPIAMSMAAAMPIVSSVTHTGAELLEDRHTALLVPPNSPRQLAQRVLDLYEDRGLQWSISDRARSEAYDYFSLTRMLSEYRTLYQQLASGD